MGGFSKRILTLEWEGHVYTCAVENAHLEELTNVGLQLSEFGSTFGKASDFEAIHELAYGSICKLFGEDAATQIWEGRESSVFDDMDVLLEVQRSFAIFMNRRINANIAAYTPSKVIGH